jgi:beta-lactamase superfamily II metal-dependent hydrolase
MAKRCDIVPVIDRLEKDKRRSLALDVGKDSHQSSRSSRSSNFLVEVKPPYSIHVRCVPIAAS